MEKIEEFISNQYKNNIPTNVRAFVRGALGIKTPIDENFFRPEELDALRTAAARGLADYDKKVRPALPDSSDQKSYQDYKKKYTSDKYRGEYQNPHISYWDYDKPWTGGNMPSTLLGWVSNPSTVAQTTIGSALIKKNENGHVNVVDKYNFEPHPGTGMFGSMGTLHRIGERLIPEGYDINVNLGNPEEWGPRIMKTRR